MHRICGFMTFQIAWKIKHVYLMQGAKQGTYSYSHFVPCTHHLSLFANTIPHTRLLHKNNANPKPQTKLMPSSHPLPNLKRPWRWLTTRAKNTPPQEDPQRKTRRASFTNCTSLAKPEPALHRLQELKSPPPLTAGPDSPGFKSRPLYRRTGSSPADRAEEEEKGRESEESGLAMSGVNRRKMSPSTMVVMDLAKSASDRKLVGHTIRKETEQLIRQIWMGMKAMEAETPVRTKGILVAGRGDSL